MSGDGMLSHSSAASHLFHNAAIQSGGINIDKRHHAHTQPSPGTHSENNKTERDGTQLATRRTIATLRDTLGALMIRSHLHRRWSVEKRWKACQQVEERWRAKKGEVHQHASQPRSGTHRGVKINGRVRAPLATRCTTVISWIELLHSHFIDQKQGGKMGNTAVTVV